MGESSESDGARTLTVAGVVAFVILSGLAALAVASCSPREPKPSATAAQVEEPAKPLDVVIEELDPGPADGTAAGTQGPEPAEGYGSAALAEAGETEEVPSSGGVLLGNMGDIFSAASYSDSTWIVVRGFVHRIDDNGRHSGLRMPPDFHATVVEPGDGVLWVGGFFETEVIQSIGWSTGDAGVVAVQADSDGAAAEVVYRSAVPDTNVLDLILSSQGTLMVLTDVGTNIEAQSHEQALHEISPLGELIRSEPLGELVRHQANPVFLLPSESGGAEVLVEGGLFHQRVVLAPFAEDRTPSIDVSSLQGEGTAIFASRGSTGRVQVFFGEYSRFGLVMQRTVLLSDQGRTLVDNPLDPPVVGVLVRGSEELIRGDEDGQLVVPN